MTTAVSRRNFDKFVFLWCDYYGLAIETANVLYASDLVTGDNLLSLNGQQINALPVTLSQRCLLRGALLQYSSSMQVVNKDIWKTILMSPIASGQPTAQAPEKMTKTVAGFRKMRHIFDMLDTFNEHKEISDTDHVVAQLDHQRELRRRLHKRRTRPNDNMTLAERILKQRQQFSSGSEMPTRSYSAPPANGDLTKSASSLISVQSTPAASSTTADEQRYRMDGSASNFMNSCNELNVPKSNFPRNGDEEARMETVGQNAEVSADVHDDVDISNTSVAKSVSSIGGSKKGGNEGTDDASVTNKPDETIIKRGTFRDLVKNRVMPMNEKLRAHAAAISPVRSGTPNTPCRKSDANNPKLEVSTTDETETISPVLSGTLEPLPPIADANKLAVAPEANNHPETPTRRPLPSFLQSNVRRPQPKGSTPEPIPLETLNLRRHMYSGPLTDAEIQQLELELFTNNDRTVLSDYRTKQDNLQGEDALQRIMTGEFDRDLQKLLNA